jgi:protein O-GlcNAc transferase
LRGDCHAGRVGASLLTRVGLEKFIAESEEQYVEIGMKLARNFNGLVRLRAGMRARMKASALCDAGSFARTAENTFQMVWKHWCQKNDPNAHITTKS